MDNISNSNQLINNLVDMADFTCVSFDLSATKLTLSTNENESSNKLGVDSIACKTAVMASVESAVNGNTVKLIFPASLDFNLKTDETVFTGGTFDIKTMGVTYSQQIGNERKGRIALETDDIHVDKLRLLAQALDVKPDIGIPMPKELECLLVQGLNSFLQDDILNKQDIMSVGEDTFVSNATEKLIAEATDKTLKAFAAMMGKQQSNHLKMRIKKTAIKLSFLLPIIYW